MSLVSLLNDIATPYGLFNVNIGFSCKCLIEITLFSMFDYFGGFNCTIIKSLHEFVRFQVFLSNMNNTFNNYNLQYILKRPISMKNLTKHLPNIYIYIYIYIYYSGTIFHIKYIYARPFRLSTLVKEFTAAARIMQTSSNELSTLVSGKV